jgi:hypothetical protein
MKKIKRLATAQRFMAWRNRKERTLKCFRISGRPCLLHAECVSGFREDRRCGLVYGLYRVRIDNQYIYPMDAEEYSILAWTCPYCGGEETC